MGGKHEYLIIGIGVAFATLALFSNHYIENETFHALVWTYLQGR